MSHEYTHKIVDKTTGEFIRLCRIEAGKVQTPLTDRWGLTAWTWQRWISEGFHIVPRLVEY